MRQCFVGLGGTHRFDDTADRALVKDIGLGGRFLLFVKVLQRQQERIVGIPPEGEGVGTAGEAAVLGDEPVVAAVQAASQIRQCAVAHVVPDVLHLGGEELARAVADLAHAGDALAHDGVRPVVDVDEFAVLSNMDASAMQHETARACAFGSDDRGHREVRCCGRCRHRHIGAAGDQVVGLLQRRFQITIEDGCRYRRVAARDLVEEAEHVARVRRVPGIHLHVLVVAARVAQFLRHIAEIDPVGVDRFAA